ncbi:unnamed protein product [Ectocarpus sp. 6 AP-2014]
MQSVVMRSSAGREWESSRSVSPKNGWAVITPPLAPSCSLSPLGSGHRSAAGGKRRFFGLSETAEAEAEAAAVKAELEGGRRRGGVVADKVPAPPAGEGGGAKDSIDAHRALLSLRSDPMRAMLRSGMRESFTMDVLVKDIRPAVFTALLTYLYTDTLQLQRPEDITELLVVANQYTLTDLLSLCEGFLQGVLDDENASHLYHYADALGMPTFEHRCLTFILRNWRKVVRTEGWMHLPSDLRARATAFRSRHAHLFMLGQRDHVTWKGGESEMMADWVLDRIKSDGSSWMDDVTEEEEALAMAGEEGWQTASEGEGDDAHSTATATATAAFFSPESQSPATSQSPTPASRRRARAFLSP